MPRSVCSLLAIVLVAFLSGCGTSLPPADHLVDPEATAETRALYASLQQLTGEHVLFGHHESLSYGVEWHDEPGRSDVKAVTGSFPALVGFDILSYKEGVEEVDAEDRAVMRERILRTYRFGGVVALTWHVYNPVSGGDSWDTTRAVGAIIPGGPQHGRFKEVLDGVAAFLKSLRTEDGTLVPVIFRPYHEMNGSWFWWGGRHATPHEYVALWQFTVEYLRDEKDVHNLLWAYCPDIFDTRGGYLTRYPSDAYVDVLGFDDYYDFYGEEALLYESGYSGRLR